MDRLVGPLVGSLVVGCASLAVVAGCAPRTYVVTEAPHIAVESGDDRRDEAPRRVVQWYPNFWRAIANMNVPIAWTLAESRDERVFAEALQAMQDGDVAEADSALRPLLESSDTVVRIAARVTYGALLSAQGEWKALADVAPLLSMERDAAGVARWAPAFAAAKTRAVFDDNVVTLPLERAATGAPMVAVRINGVVKHFWLDTGSSISMLSSSVAAECGVVVSSTNADARADRMNDTLELLTAVGRIPARPALINELHLGPLMIHEMPAMIVDAADLELRGTAGAPGVGRAGVSSLESDLAPGAGRNASPITLRVDGIIGIDVIRRLDITIDDGRGRVIIRKPVRHEEDRGHPRNVFWFGVPIVTLLSERGIPVHFSLDTGAEETYGMRTVGPRAGAGEVRGERRVVNGFGARMPEQGVVVPRMRLFVDGVPLVFQRVFLYNARYPTIFELDGTLGSDVGRGGVLRLDMTNGRFEVAP